MPSRFHFQAIGTTWNIDIPGELAPDREESLLKAIKDRIDIFDRDYSRFRADSLVAEMSKKAGEYVMPDDALPMLSLYEELYEATGGLMTPLIGQVISDAGYDAAYSLAPKAAIAQAKTWDSVMEYGHPVLEMKEPALLDLGAMGKGYLIDIVARIIRDRGIESYTVDAGGDIAYRGARLDGSTSPLRVGLEDPDDLTKVVGVATIRDQSICGSAGNRRAWDRFHHIINPETVESPRHILALWVVADTTLLADATSTALFFAKPEALALRYDFECAILYADRTAFATKGFPGEFFT